MNDSIELLFEALTCIFRLYNQIFDLCGLTVKREDGRSFFNTHVCKQKDLIKFLAVSDCNFDSDIGKNNKNSC